MLYDPKWNGPSLTSFIAWLESKDPKKKYSFANCRGECLLGQYMTAIGIEWGDSPASWNDGSWSGTNYIKVARQIFGMGDLEVLAAKPHTYGAALKRARVVRP